MDSSVPPIDPKAPRVLVDGPGGAEVKQGARIACDNCRQAKIKCSAPTDGQVPCSRCLKAQKPCLFYKHQRGRKPGRLNNRTKKDAAAAGASGAAPSSDNDDDGDDDDDSMPLASTSSSAVPTPSKPAPLKTYNKSGTSSKASSSKANPSSPTKSRPLSLSTAGTGPLSSHFQGSKLPPDTTHGHAGQKRKRNSSDFRPAGPAALVSHVESMAGSSPNFKYSLLARAPSPAPSRTSTVGSTSGPTAVHHSGKRAGSTSDMPPPALLQRSSLSASGSGSGAGSRTTSRRGSGSPLTGPTSPTSKAAYGHPSGQHGQQAGGRRASPEEAAMAASSLMWYSSSTAANSSAPAVAHDSHAPHPSMPSTSMEGNPYGSASSTAQHGQTQQHHASQQQQQQQQQNSTASSLAMDASAFTAGLLDPNSFVNAFSHLDYERQRLLMPIYQAAQQQIDQPLSASSMSGLAPGQAPQMMDWQKRLQEQMQQAAYDPHQIAAAAAAVQHISDVLVQQTQQHQQQAAAAVQQQQQQQQHVAMQHLLGKSSLHGGSGADSSALGGSSSSGGGSGSGSGPTATHGPGHITIPAHPPHPSHQSSLGQPHHSLHLSHSAAGSQRSSMAISPTTPLGAPAALPLTGGKTYASNPRNGPTSAPLPGMPGYPNQFPFAMAPASGALTPGASSNSMGGANVPAQPAATSTQQQQQGIMAPPPPRHSSSFHGFESSMSSAAGHPRMQQQQQQQQHGRGSGVAGGQGRSGSFGDAMHSAGRGFGGGAGAGMQPSSNVTHNRSSSVYDAGLGGFGGSAAAYGQTGPSASASQLPPSHHLHTPHDAGHHQQLHMSGGKMHSPAMGAGAGTGVGAGGGAGHAMLPAAAQMGSMPLYVHGARGANRPSALKTEQQQQHSAGAAAGGAALFIASSGTTSGTGTNTGTATGETSRGSGTPVMGMDGGAGVGAGGGPLSRLRSLSNESGSGSGGGGPAMKRARLEGNVAARASRPIDEEDEEEDEGEDGDVQMGDEMQDGEDDEDDDDEDDDDDDEDDEDADSEAEDDHVLSNPLKLLAQASGAAAAMDPSGPEYQLAAETMGLLCVRRDESTGGASASPSNERSEPKSDHTRNDQPDLPYANRNSNVEAPPKRSDAPLDFYRTSRASATPAPAPASASAPSLSGRSLTSPRNRSSDLSSLPSLVRNPPGSTAPAPSGLTVAAGGPLNKPLYRPPRAITDDLHWMLGPRRLTSSVAALVGAPRRYMRPAGLPVPEGPAYRSGLPPLPSSMSDSAILSETPTSAGRSSFMANGLAVGAGRREGSSGVGGGAGSAGGSVHGSVHDDDGVGPDGDDRRMQFPRRRAGRGFESSSARSTGGMDEDDDLGEREGSISGLGVRRSILSDTRRTSMGGGAGFGVGPNSPIQHSLSQPSPIRPSDLFRSDEAEARLVSSQPEPLRSDSRHGTLTAESLLELKRSTQEMERGDGAGERGHRAEDKTGGKENTAGPEKAPEQSNRMDVDAAAGMGKGPSPAAQPITTTSPEKQGEAAKDVGNTSIQSDAIRPASALGKTSPDVSMDASSAVRTPDRSGAPPPSGAVATGSADKSMENPSLSPAMSPPVRRRRLSLSIDTPKDGMPSGVFPSPSQHADWEYKDGRAQTRRTKGGSVSSGSGVPFQGLHLLPGIGVRGGKAHTVAGGLTPAMKPVPGPSIVPSPTPAADGEFLPPPLLPRAIVPPKKQPKSLVSFSGLESSPLHLDAHSPLDAFLGRRRRPLYKDKKEKDRMKKKKSTAGMTDMSSRSKLTIQTRFQDDGKDDIMPNMGDDESDDGFKRGYFNVSMWHQKLDIDEESEDPVLKGYIELKEVERLFDVFFNHINPLLLVFDPFLHSVGSVRRRSAFLTTVIISLAARFVDTQRDAALAVSLEHLWLGKQLPRILSEGYKSIEIAQAFVILAMFHKPMRSLADDRSWQYLGFAIRMATEIGVNRRIKPSEAVRSREQVRRRERNRERLWCNLFLCDRIMSAQTGRPWTISDDLLSPEVSGDWHLQDFALPSDGVVVSMIRLRRIVARHTTELDSFLSKEHQSLARNPQVLSYLEYLRRAAENDLERWRDSWSETGNGEQASAPEWGPFSTHWTPISKLYYQHSLLHLNSFALQAIEKFDLSSNVYKDCWTSALEVVKIVLELGQAKLMYAPNHLIVMAVYAAVSVLRLLNKDKSKNPWINREEAIGAVRELISALNDAGKTPQHRNGAAVPYAKYLTSVLALWDPPAPKPKSKDPPRATSPNRLRSVSDAAAVRMMRPREREMAAGMSTNAIIMPATTDPRERKAERNSLGSTRVAASSAAMNNSSLLASISSARPSTSAAETNNATMAMASLPVSAAEAPAATPTQPLLHPHPINFDSLGVWAGNVPYLMPTTPTGDAFALQRTASSAPITALSTPAIGADTSGDISTSGGMDMTGAATGTGAGAGMEATSLGAPFFPMSMGGVAGLNVAGVTMPRSGTTPFLMTGPVAPSTSSTAAAAPGSAGPTMMRAPHQQRHVSGGQIAPPPGFGNPGTTAGTGPGVGGFQIREGFLDDANWTFPTGDADGAIPTEGATGDDGERDRLWDYLTSWDGSANGVTSGFWQPQQSSWNFSSY
ncbi:hypothetical protein OC844_004369 [Tilletia horrida]|nr:hypothetical protein OC844_004369 [Tilletia horrida]